jgi:hypothetical protein
VEQKKRWSDLTPRQRTAIVVGAALELILTSIALADLQKRPSALVRGPKAAWRLMSFVQPVGPIVYLLVGRRRT